MALAALVLAIVAILVSIASALYTRRQTLATERIQAVDAARRQDSLKPTLVGEYVAGGDTRDGVRPGIRLTNRGPLDLDRVEVQTVPAHRSHEAVVKGIYDPRTDDDTIPVQETGIMRQAESWTLEVVPLQDTEGNDRGGTHTLRCAATPPGTIRGL